MKEYAKHKVRVEIIDELVPEDPPRPGSRFALMVPNGKTFPDWDIEHTEECDNLKYKQQCALDWMLDYDTEGMPTESGTYLVWVVDESGYVNNWSHCGWEAEYYINYEKIEDE